MSTILHIDLETYSPEDIGKVGVYKYVEHPDFEILLLAYALNDGPVKILDLTDKDTWDSDSFHYVIESIKSPNVIKVAHNCSFERCCLGKVFGYTPPEQWKDTMILAAMNGLPMSLDAVGSALNLYNQKIREGKLLINYFCKPCSPTVSNKGRTRNLPEHAPDKWKRFKEYCIRDVEVEQEIYQLLYKFPIPKWEDEVRYLDSRINEYGVLTDTEFALAAVGLNDKSVSRCIDELKELTRLDNPNSISQLKAWLDSVGCHLDSLGKGNIEDAINSVGNPIVKRVLLLRSLIGKTSVKKYEALLRAASNDDHRLRGMMQYYGAPRTGRWSGRLFQPQNMAVNKVTNIKAVRDLVLSRDLDMLELVFDSVPDILSQLIRTSLIAKEGYTFLVADFSAIEARVIAYLSGCSWRQKVFAEGGDIYCSSASQMFKVPVVKHGINGHLRQKGKVAELA